MPRGWSPCTRCPDVAPPGHSMCTACRAGTDKARRPDGNPYSTAAHHAFREAVLARYPYCVDCKRAPSTVADHDPHERVDLVAMGLDPNDPECGKGRCKRCHDRKTARTKPGGWNARD